MTSRTQLRRRGRLSPFLLAPNELASGLYAWYKADSYGGSNGDLVSTWADSSGNGRDVTAAGAARPTFVTPNSVLNNKPTMLAAGAASMRNDALAAMFSGTDVPYTLLFAVNSHSISSFRCLLGAARAASATPFLEHYTHVATDMNIFRKNDAGTLKQQVASVALDFNVGHIWRFWFDGTNSQVCRDGVQIGALFAASTGSAMTLDRATLFSDITNTGATGDGYNGDIAEAVLISRAATANELLGLERYLGRKYKIATP